MPPKTGGEKNFKAKNRQEKMLPPKPGREKNLSPKTGREKNVEDNKVVKKTILPPNTGREKNFKAKNRRQKNVEDKNRQYKNFALRPMAVEKIPEAKNEAQTGKNPVTKKATKSFKEKVHQPKIIPQRKKNAGVKIVQKKFCIAESCAKIHPCAKTSTNSAKHSLTLKFITLKPFNLPFRIDPKKNIAPNPPFEIPSRPFPISLTFKTLFCSDSNVKPG